MAVNIGLKDSPKGANGALDKSRTIVPERSLERWGARGQAIARDVWGQDDAALESVVFKQRSYRLCIVQHDSHRFTAASMNRQRNRRTEV